METLLIGLPTLLAVVSLAVVVVVCLRNTSRGENLSVPLQNLTQAVQQGQSQGAVIAEKVAHLESLTQTMNGIQVEIKGISERVSKLEQDQNQANHSLVALRTGLTETGTVAKSLVEATNAIRGELLQATTGLTELQTHAKARQEVEQRTAESIRRLEAVIAGTQTKGNAGENILQLVLSKLPADWQVRNFRVGDKIVEFGLRLPNNLVLPIDSKWTATNLLEQFTACNDPGEQQKLKTQIEATVLNRAREVTKYIDPNLTVNFGLAVVPDAIYDLCYGIQTDVFRENVVLVSYSMFVPYLLLVFQTILKASQNIDLQKLDAYLENAHLSIKVLQDELEGRFSRAITMLNNSRNDMSVHLSKVSSGLTSLQIGAAAPSQAVTLNEV